MRPAASARLRPRSAAVSEGEPGGHVRAEVDEREGLFGLVFRGDRPDEGAEAGGRTESSGLVFGEAGAAVGVEGGVDFEPGRRRFEGPAHALRSERDDWIGMTWE